MSCPDTHTEISVFAALLYLTLKVPHSAKLTPSVFSNSNLCLLPAVTQHISKTLLCKPALDNVTGSPDASWTPLPC